MSIEQYILIALNVLGSLGSILMIGKKRDPLTPTTATISVIINAAIIALIVRI